ncbi:MAG: arginase [Crenarchaeota archaeon]|nr:arginase [Thermoproteota archaeon]
MTYIVEPTSTFIQSQTGIGDLENIYIIGIPLEDTTSFRQGTKYAPTIIRQVSPYLEATTSTLRNITNKNIRDLGDIALLHGNITENVRRIRETIKELIMKDLRKIILIGGEHTITYASCTGIRDTVLLIVLDAHLDMRDEWPLGQKLSHATHLRRLIEEKDNIYLIHLCARAFDDEELNFVKMNKDRILMININDFREMNNGILLRTMKDFVSTITKIDLVYISVDLDVLDISCMPAVSNPEGYGGLSYEELMNILSLLRYITCRTSRVLCDVVEYCPSVDPGLTYCSTVVKLILDLIDLYFT